MRTIFLSLTVSLALLSSAALAQEQGSGSLGESIGSPPPLPGPPPAAGPPPTAAPPAPAASNSTPKGYTGAYAPASENSPAPAFKGPLPEATTGSGLNVIAPDGVSTRTVKAVPCGLVARETDGSTTCVGISDDNVSSRRKRR
jgi:hypothetical protein